MADIGRDWGGYVAAITQNEPVQRVACPLCGTPLDFRDGLTHCPFDGWTGEETDTA